MALAVTRGQRDDDDLHDVAGSVAAFQAGEARAI
jgi:hypothetical protein